MRTQAERLAAVETSLKQLHRDFAETKRDIKTLVAAHERQKGGVKILGLIGSVVIGIGGYFTGTHFRP